MRKKILVIDDIEINAKLVKAILEKTKFDVSYLCKSEKAIEMVQDICPNLILLDIFMPVMDGFTILDKLVNKLETRNIPVIMYSSVREQSDIKKAIDKGASDFIIKPIRKEDLLNKVNSILSN